MWGLIYFVSLVISALVSIKDRDMFRASIILIGAFFVTRLIKDFIDERFLFDIANDAIAVGLLIWLVKKSLPRQGIIACYGLMPIFAYVPAYMERISLNTNYIILDVLAFLQIGFLLWGATNGYINRNRINSSNNAYRGGNSALGLRLSNGNSEDQEEDNKAIKEGL